MSSPDAEPNSQPTLSNIESEPTVSVRSRGRSPIRLWFVTLAAGLLAGVGSWWAAEHVYGRARMERVTSMGIGSPEETRARQTTLSRGITDDASLTFAILGAAVGFALGVAGGIARGAAPAGLGAAVVGSVFAAAAGFLATHLMLPIYFGAFRADNNDLGLAVLAQGGICAPIGAAAGAAFGLGLREGGRRLDFRFLAGGLLGAIAGVVFYQAAGAIAFPFDGTALPISTTWSARLLAHTSIVVLTAVGALTARSFGPRRG